jgi:hypothetical protein
MMKTTHTMVFTSQLCVSVESRISGLTPSA